MAQTAPPVVTIMEIQGSEQSSALDGQEVETSGVVTLFTANDANFWLQDPSGDSNPATSDGIFVAGGGYPDSGPRPEVGDFIRIIASVEENQYGNALPLTRLRNVALIEVLSSGNPLPEPVRLQDLPNELITEGIDFWEPLEGMLVSVHSGHVVAPTTSYGEFALITPRDRWFGSGFSFSNSHLLIRGLGDERVDYNPERIVVDDSTLDEAIVVRPGDVVYNLVGAVDYTFSCYKLQPVSVGSVIDRPLPSVPVSERSRMEGNFAITTYNVENLFDLVDNPDKEDEGSTPEPDELETQLTKLALAIELELRLPEIIVVQEVENTAILQELGNRVNAATGTNYVATSFETSDVRGIEVGFLWDDDRVDLLDAFQLTDDIVPGVSDAFGPDSPSPGREPLVGMFDVTGNIQDPLWIIGNHFKSKSGDNPLYGVNQPPIRVTEVQRKMQAHVVRDFADSILDADPHAWVIATGDLNDFQFSEPGEGTDHPAAILEGGTGQVRLTNLLKFERLDQRFTFVYDGNSQVLDHMLISPVLLRWFRGVDILHFNAGFPDALSEDPSTPLRASDHDALEGRFWFKKAIPSFTLTVLHNNDGESQLINAGSGLEDFGGVARFATVVDNLKAEAMHGPGRRGVLMLSSGDNFLAGPEFNASLEKGMPFYDTVAMRLTGYDAAALGNHEFDFGPDILADFINGFESSLHFVSANLDFSGEPNLQILVDQGVIVKSLIVRQNFQQIGIVGATTPNLPFISSPRNVVVDPDVAAAIQGEIDRLKAKRVNKIIIISHLQDVDEDQALAPLLHDVDVMIAGGGDEVLANPGDLLVPGDEIFDSYPLFATGADGATIPVVTTAGDYKYVGRLIVNFDWYGRVISVDDASGPVRVAGGTNPDAVEPDPDVQAQVVDPVQAYVDDLANNVIGTSEVNLDGRRSPGVRTQETNEGNLMADSLFWQADQLAASFGVNPPDIALQNGGGIRNNNVIPPGNITELDTFSIAPFSNFVTIIEDIPPEQLKEIMENAVSSVESASGRFAQISGFTMVYDAASTPQELDDDGNVVTPGTRVQEITLDDGTSIVSGGIVVSGAPAVNIATIDFLARGGDQYPYRGAPFITLGVTYQQALSNYITDGLSGVISAVDYPEGGEGRITRLN